MPSLDAALLPLLGDATLLPLPGASPCGDLALALTIHIFQVEFYKHTNSVDSQKMKPKLKIQDSGMEIIGFTVGRKEM